MAVRRYALLPPLRPDTSPNAPCDVDDERGSASPLAYEYAE